MSLFALLSDVHGNHAALKAVVADIEKQGASIVTCLGDTVGYGPDPKACVDLVQQLCFPVLMGNHETYVTLPFEPDEFDPRIQGGIEVAREQLSDDQMTWLRELPIVIEMGDATVVHASLDEPIEFKHLISPGDAERHFENQETPLCFIGHTHLPMIVEESAKGIRFFEPPEIPVELDMDLRYVVNVGSVGQPRDGDSRACYVLYDSETSTVLFRRVAYDLASTRVRIREVGLDEAVAERLEKGE